MNPDNKILKGIQYQMYTYWESVVYDNWDNHKTTLLVITTLARTVVVVDRNM